MAFARDGGCFRSVGRFRGLSLDPVLDGWRRTSGDTVGFSLMNQAICVGVEFILEG